MSNTNDAAPVNPNDCSDKTKQANQTTEPVTKFKVDQRVKHPVSEDGKVPAGTGTVTKCCPCDGGGECEYEVRCEHTGNTGKFKESTLSAA